MILLDLIYNEAHNDLENLIDYNINMLNNYRRHQNQLINQCFRKGLKIMRIIFESFLDYNPNNINNVLTEDNIYHLDLYLY